MTNIRDDLRRFFDDNLQEYAKEHLQVWKDRYATMGTSAIIYDLKINYDWSCEYETVEQEIGRPLTDNEKLLFEQKFISAIRKARR